MKRILLIAVIMIALPTMAFGATKTTDMLAYGTVLPAGECTLSGGNLGFGNMTPPISSNIDTAGSLYVTCPADTPYNISISTGGSGTYSPRQMSELLTPSNKMNYNIYTDTTWTTIWGDGTGGTATVPGTGNGAMQYLNVYGRVSPQPTPAPGDYQDVVTITLTY